MKIKKNNLIFLLMIIPIFEPDIFKSFNVTDNIFNALKIFVAIISTVEYIKTSKKPRFGWIIFLYIGTFFLSTALNHQSVLFCFQKVIEALIAVMILEVGIRRIGYQSIYMLFTYLSFLMYIEFVTCIIFPNGMLTSSMESENYKMYFLGIKNGFIGWAILLCTCGLLSFYYNRENKIKWQLIGQYIIISAIILIIKSTTGTIAWLVFCILTYFFIIKSSKFSFYKIMPGMIIIYFSVVIFRIQEKFAYLIELLFHKSASLTGRTVTWDMALSFIKNRILYGYGIRQIEVIQTAYGRGYTAHNFSLYLLLCGGLLSFSIIVIIVIYFIRSSYIYREYKVEKILSAALVAFFIATLTESGIYNAKWITIFVLYGNISKLISMNNKVTISQKASSKRCIQ